MRYRTALRPVRRSRIRAGQCVEYSEPRQAVQPAVTSHGIAICGRDPANGRADRVTTGPQPGRDAEAGLMILTCVSQASRARMTLSPEPHASWSRGSARTLVSTDASAASSDVVPASIDVVPARHGGVSPSTDVISSKTGVVSASTDARSPTTGASQPSDGVPHPTSVVSSARLVAIYPPMNGVASRANGGAYAEVSLASSPNCLVHP